MTIKTLLNFSQYLILALPIALITGPFFSDFIAIILNLVFIYILIKKKDIKFLKNKFFYFFLLFWFLFLFRSFFSDDILFSVKSSFSFLRSVILPFAIYYILRMSSEDYFKKYYRTLFLLIAIFIFDMIFQYFVGHNLLGFKIENPDKINGLFGDEGISGSYLLRFLPLILISVFFINYEKKNYLLFLTFSFVIYAIFISGSRSSFFLSCIFIFLFFLFFKEFRKYLLIGFFSLSLIVISFSFFFKASKHSLLYNIADPIKSIFFTNEKTFDYYDLKKRKIVFFTPVYQSHYESAILMFKDNIVFGQGTKMFRKKCLEKKYIINHVSCTTHPHNFYIQFLAENGLVGFAFILIIFIFLLREFYINLFFREKKNRNFNEILILCGLICSFFPLSPSGNFFNNWLSICIFYQFGFYLFYKKNKVVH